jgi:Protein of unknown function (DUF2938)
MSVFSLRSVFIGILATITMDVLSVTALKLGLIAFLPPRLTGRWFASVARGQILHNDIGRVPPINHEMAVAVPMHYAVGITLAILYLLLVSALRFSPRNLIIALPLLCARTSFHGCSCFRPGATAGSAHMALRERDCFLVVSLPIASMAWDYGVAC